MRTERLYSGEMQTVSRAALVLAVATTVTIALGSEIALATPPGCGEQVIDDPLAGATVGVAQGGTLDAAGFVPGGSDPPGSIVWGLDPPIRAGCVEVTISGVVTAGVGEHDLVELFTGPDGSFSDGATDHFLLLKIAGDVFPGYEGRLKVEIGREYEVLEVGSWADALPWAQADSYTLSIRLDGAGIAEFYRDDVLLASVDYNEIAGGNLAFASLRIPNDGEYQVSAPLNGVQYRDVRVFDADPGGGGETTGGEAGSAGVDDTAGEGTGGGSASGGVQSGTIGSGSTAATSDTSVGPGSGLPLPSGGGEVDGCTCRASGRGGVGALGLMLLGLVGRGRRRARRA